MKILIIFFAVTIVLSAAIGIALFLQNQKPKITPGLENGKLREIPDKKNAVSTQTAYADKLIAPLNFKSTLEETKEAMKKAMASYGDMEIIEESADHIYAVGTTKRMKFRDDVEIYFDEADRKIHFRSASRAGYSDLGVNRKRYNEISEMYNSY